MMSKRKKILIILGVVCLLSLLGFGIYSGFYYKKSVQEKNKALEMLEKEMAFAFVEYDGKIEYGDVWEYATFLKCLTNFPEDLNITLLVNEKILNTGDSYSFLKPGENTVTITMKKDYTYQFFKTYTNEVAKDKTFILFVEDTIKPEIFGVKDRTITIGENIDLKKGISAIDNADGNVDIEIIGEVDTNKTGTYTIRVKATDKSGNIAEQEFNVFVKKKTTASKSN